MTDDERALLLAVSRCVAEQLEARAADEFNDTDQVAKHMRALIAKIRPRDGGN